MKWTKATIDTTVEAIDFICIMLDEKGVEGIEIEDNVGLTPKEIATMYIDIPLELPSEDNSAKVSFYINILDENGEDGSDYGNAVLNREEFIKLLEDVKNELDSMRSYVDIGEGTISVSSTEDKDWINNWKEFFKPFKVADDIIIKPTWETLSDEESKDNLVIEIDPGTAFGTGAHETTKLCILSLRKYINDTTDFIDVGCGSGILSIIGLKLGARSAFLTDIDKHAIEATVENFKVNGIAKDLYELKSGNIIEDKELMDMAGYKKYDIAVANILAGVIIPLSGQIGKHIKKGGLFISSGIINTMADEVRENILSNGFEIIEENRLKDWVSFVAKKL
ncbi:MAG: 50S ribosomal protein L11 methyltransferase [Lachnospiraceae bacterium]|nr:50S ribosomal protein L11 methyltransferase [Lachnospiraceae bacterium]